MNLARFARLLARSSLGEARVWRSFGVTLHANRTEARVSLPELARRSQMTTSRILELEHGTPPHPSPAEVEAYARGLDLEPGPLVELSTQITRGIATKESFR